MNSKYQPGGEYLMKVVRQSAIGAFLDAGTGNTSDDILLHLAQQTASVEVGDVVPVSLYLDPQKRLAASMRLATLKEGEVGRMPVINVTKQGAFVSIGAERGVFLPFSEMRGRVMRGQTVWVKLYRDKTGRQAVTMKVEEELKAMSKPAAGARVGQEVTGWVYNDLDDGWLLFTEEGYIAFLHKDEAGGGMLKMGEEVKGRIAFIRPDGRINISRRPQKETAMGEDAEKIIGYLKGRQGRMPYGDATPPDIVREKFQLSKAAFKRALGRLLKEGTIRQEDGWTVLVAESGAEE